MSRERIACRPIRAISIAMGSFESGFRINIQKNFWFAFFADVGAIPAPSGHPCASKIATLPHRSEASKHARSPHFMGIF
jgi:hypothetical protein